jgi:hypothetical protein
MAFSQSALMAYSMLWYFNEKNVPFRLMGQKRSLGGSNGRTGYQIGWEKEKPFYGQSHGDSAGGW